MNKKPYEIIKELLNEKEKTQREYANDINISEVTISRWKKGVIPRIEILQKTAEYFNVSIEYLLGTEHTRKNDQEEKTDINTLSFEEKEIIYNFRKANQCQKEQIIEIIKILTNGK